jgi:ATP-binding cassette, subfamily B, bacterial
MQDKGYIKSEIWKNIFGIIFPYKKKFFLVVFISLLSTGANLIEPLIYREAINDVAGLFVEKAKQDTRQEFVVDSVTTDNDSTLIENEDPAVEVLEKVKHKKSYVASRTPEQALKTLLWAVVLIFLVNIIGNVLVLIGGNMNVKLACNIEQGFIQNTFSHVLRQPLAFFSKRSSAALAKQINQSEEVSGVVNGFSEQILPEIISLTGILIIMFSQNVTLSLIALIVIPFYLLIAWRSATKLETGLTAYYERWEEVSARMQDALGGIKTVKLSGAEQREVNEFKKISNQAYIDYIKRNKLSNQYVFWENALTNLASALVLGYGGYLTLEKQLTPGDVVMFVAYLDRLYSPIDALASLWVNLQQNVVSLARAFKLLKDNPEEEKGKGVAVSNGLIEFDHVHFGYTPEKEVLKGISFSLEPGKITALVGTSGAGKTTTVDLLMKLYEPNSGEIRIDGKKLSEIDAASIRSQVGMVAADGAIFRGTLADNIRYKKPTATDQEVLAAAHAAGMQNTLERLPDGLKTLVGESGFGLSVGERQRIQIARVLVAKPKILVLDEATANLDYATEAEVKKTVEEIKNHSTIIVIAHRYSMVKNADLVLVLSDGQVIEKGTPHELIAMDGWFTGFAHAVDEGGKRDVAAEKNEGEEEDGDDVEQSTS